MHTTEQGKLLCDQFIERGGVHRVELVDSEKGEVLYARGYRPNPAATVQRKRAGKDSEQSELFAPVPSE